MKSKQHTYAAVTFALIIFWFMDSFVQIFNINPINSVNFADYLTVGFYNMDKSLGMVMPIVYSLFIYRFIVLKASHNIIRYGKKEFTNKEILDVATATLIFTLEYQLINAIGCLFICDINILAQYKFLLFNLICFPGLYFYFLLIGASMLFFRNLLSFKKIYIIFAPTLYSILVSFVYIITIKLSPVFELEYISIWLYLGTFDVLPFIVSLIKLLFPACIIFALSKLIFYKKDIIIYEEN